MPLETVDPSSGNFRAQKEEYEKEYCCVRKIGSDLGRFCSYNCYYSVVLLTAEQPSVTVEEKKKNEPLKKRSTSCAQSRLVTKYKR